jgi:hypothetical protein
MAGRKRSIRSRSFLTPAGPEEFPELPRCDDGDVLVSLQNEQIPVTGYQVVRMSRKGSAENGNVLFVAALS